MNEIKKNEAAGSREDAAATERKDVEKYEAPRITRRRSLERVTLGSALIGPGGTID